MPYKTSYCTKPIVANVPKALRFQLRAGFAVADMAVQEMLRGPYAR